MVKGNELYYIAVQCYDVASVLVSRSGPVAISAYLFFFLDSRGSM